jgi:Predicted integral membrane protein (DUF2269)
MNGRTTSRRFPQGLRHAVLTVHIAMSVGLLGDSAGFLAVAIKAARSGDSRVMQDLGGVLNMFGMVFGIPLSVGAIVTGVLLGLGTKWGVFRYPWVTTKLLLIVSVMLVGGFVIGPAQAVIMKGSGDAMGQLIAAASYDVVALTRATALSVFKPGGAFRRVATAAASA